MTDLQVLVRHPRWAVLAKPGGVACHRSKQVHDRDTIVSRARQRFGEGVHLVHRLDRGASGCLLVAFDPLATHILAEALAAPEATKTYVALVRGYFRWDDVVRVETPIKDPRRRLLPARTDVVVLARSVLPRCSLVIARPRTGRHHQVRRHLRDLGHPILGDTQHGDSPENVRWREAHGLDRLQLHALSMALPASRLPVQAWCPLPSDLLRLWQQMPWWDEARARQPLLDAAPLADVPGPREA